MMDSRKPGEKIGLRIETSSTEASERHRSQGGDKRLSISNPHDITDLEHRFVRPYSAENLFVGVNIESLADLVLKCSGQIDFRESGLFNDSAVYELNIELCTWIFVTAVILQQSDL